MSSNFDVYEQQLGSLTAEITSNTSKLTNLTGGDKKKVVKQVEKNFEECRELLEQMDLEMKQCQTIERNKYQTRLKSYQAELQRLERDLKQNKLEAADSREELFGDDSNEDQKSRLLGNTERLERSGRRLDVGYNLAIETEQIGTRILEDLHSQREVIQRGKERLRDTNEDVGKSSRILSGMMRRILQNRVAIYVIGIAMVVVILIVVIILVN